MIISHRHKFLFFQNPKTGGMSLRALLEPYHDDPLPFHGLLHQPTPDSPLDLAHLNPSEVALLLPSLAAVVGTYKSLALARNPYSRFVSAVDQHFKTFHPDLPLPNMQPKQQLLAVELFIEQVLSSNDVLGNHDFVHFFPQMQFLQAPWLCQPIHILPMDDHGAFVSRGAEFLGLPPQAAPHENRSRCVLTHVLGSRKVTMFVRDFYSEDFTYFATDERLRHLLLDKTGAL